MDQSAKLISALAKLPAESREKILAAAIPEIDLMTDLEVSKMLRITPRQLQRYVRNGPPKGRARNVLDLRTVRHFRVGGSRRWNRASFMAALSGRDE